MLEQEAVYLAIEALHTKAYKHPAFHNQHEVYGVLMEEVAEFFEHVREKKPDMAGCREELADVCAVCLKALTQLCTDQGEDAIDERYRANILHQSGIQGMGA